jgi:hypothetical protein
MIIVKLQGGLGNRLFQLAKAESCKGEREVVVCEAITKRNPHDTSYDVQILLPYRRIAHLPKRYTIVRDGDAVPNSNVVLDGYFQTWNTVLPSIHPVVSDFFFVHVRRGDYLKTGSWIGIEYYRKAMPFLPGPYLLFTDDPKWCSEQPEFQACIVSSQTSSIGTLRHMAGCKGGITANSSLSFLAALIIGQHCVMPVNFPGVDCPPWAIRI